MKIYDPKAHTLLARGAAEHAADSDPDMEVGDLQSALQSCWQRLTTSQRMEVWAEQVDWLPCPDCGAGVHACETGDPGCHHCDDEDCGWKADL